MLFKKSVFFHSINSNSIRGLLPCVAIVRRLQIASIRPSWVSSFAQIPVHLYHLHGVVAEVTHATAHVLALQKLLDGETSRCINLGIGKGFSVLEAIQTASKITGKKISYVPAGRRPGDPPMLVSSNEKAVRELHRAPASGTRK